jgi:hypothetical protein
LSPRGTIAGLWFGLLAALTALHAITCDTGSHRSLDAFQPGPAPTLITAAYPDAYGPHVQASSPVPSTDADHHPEHPEDHAGCGVLVMAAELTSQAMALFLPVLAAGWMLLPSQLIGGPVTKAALHASGRGLRRPSLAGIFLLRVLCESRT